MNEYRPLISIAMPMLNSENTVSAAILSTIQQSYPHWELLLLDDGSNDNTIAVAQHFADSRIRILADGKHRGLPARLNEAVGLAKGHYIARMDADDIMYPDRLRSQVEYLTAHPDIDLLGGSMLIFKGNGHPCSIRSAKSTHDEICGRFPSGMQLPHPTWMGKRAWFQKHPYNCEMTRTEDRELLLRASPVSKYAGLPDIVLGYRESSATLSRLLPGRIKLARGYLSYARRERQLLVGVLGALGEYAKIPKDLMSVAVEFRANDSRNPTCEVPAATIAEWSNLWRDIQSLAVRCAD